MFRIISIIHDVCKISSSSATIVKRAPTISGRYVERTKVTTWRGVLSRRSDRYHLIRFQDFFWYMIFSSSLCRVNRCQFSYNAYTFPFLSVKESVRCFQKYFMCPPHRRWGVKCFTNTIQRTNPKRIPRFFFLRVLLLLFFLR